MKEIHSKWIDVPTRYSPLESLLIDEIAKATIAIKKLERERAYWQRLLRRGKGGKKR